MGSVPGSPQILVESFQNRSRIERDKMAKRPLVQTELLSADTQEFFDVLNHESDMSIVIVSVSYVDACLGALLQSFLLHSSVTEKLLDPRSGVLGSFSAKSDVAYSMGLIPKSIYQDLQQLGEIRNQFAHHHLSLTFSDSAIDAFCNKLNHIGTMKNGDFDELVFPPERMPATQERFKITVILIKNFLLQASKNVKRVEQSKEQRSDLEK